MAMAMNLMMILYIVFVLFTKYQIDPTTFSCQSNDSHHETTEQTDQNKTLTNETGNEPKLNYVCR